jgi:uncharacterized protein (DUF2147 family)
MSTTCVLCRRGLALFLGTLLVPFSAATASASPVGEWLVDGGSARVEIAPCPGEAQKLCGRITWLKSPNDESGRPRSDVKNPNPEMRQRRVLGLQMLSGLTPGEKGSWSAGKIYDPKSGKLYDSKMRLGADGALKVDGCVMMICRTQTWSRILGSAAARREGAP